MGDFSSPKRRDVFDRLRRRLELYRRHHNACTAGFDNSINTIHEQQRQETVIHRQRWLESKAKKASKQSKSNKDNSTHGPEHRNLIVTQKLKRKIDGNQIENQNLENLDDLEPSSAKKSASGTSTGFNVSVRIEHSQQENNTNVNVNVHATVETSGDAPANVEATTSVECKKEPKDDNCKGDHNESDILHPDELEALLDSIQNNKDPDSIDDHLLDELNRFDQIYQSKFLDDSDSNECKMYPGVTSVSPGLQKPGPSGYESTSPFDGNQNYNPVRSPPIQTQFRPSSSITETGPAAETLKQMAAQHQHQHAGAFPYGSQQMTDSSHYGQNGFPQGFEQAPVPNYASQSQFMNSSQNMNNMRGHVPYNQTKAETGLNYNGTKPLTHYQPTAVAQQQTPPSSLQQLQNQVQSHFNRPQMEITQTQHLQVSDGANRMQMSQTQQLQMRQPPQQISMTQQQSFSMSGANMGPNTQNSQYVNEQLKMQMMRRERAVQARNLLEEHQMQQQYMNRPPPEYKMQQPAAEGYQANTMGPNPLQTMQDMVNQTNSMQSAQYGQIKTENASVQMQNNMIQSHQIPPLQRMNSSGGHIPDVSQVSQPYQVPPMQRQQSYPGTQMSVAQNRPQRPAEPTYTSAIMRNQRPPNVNVGPDGLNISQPRSQHEWQRQMMVPQGPRQGVPQGMNRPQMAATGMMQYQYNSQNGMTSSGGMQGMHMRQTRPMQMSAMQSQAAMMQNSAQAQQMMMQQNIQMSQRVGVRTSVPSGMNGAHMDSNSQMSGSSNPPDDIMNLLDSAAQSSNPELLDSITVQSSDANNETAWLDEILGGK